MSLLDLLYIYDASISFAEERDDASMTIAHKSGMADLAKRLREFVDKGTTFSRCVVTTHGTPGHIKWGDKESIGAGGLTKYCAGQGLHRLFPNPGSRLYFNGCEVGAEPGGKEFITTAAKMFLQGRGGTAFAMTSNGSIFPIPYLHKGHVVHYGGGIISTTVGPGGIVIPDPPPKWDDPPNHRDNVGNKI